MRMREGAHRDCRHLERANTAANSLSLCRPCKMLPSCHLQLTAAALCIAVVRPKPTMDILKLCCYSSFQRAPSENQRLTSRCAGWTSSQRAA